MMQDKTYDIPLHDIKTIVEVPEYSLYYLLIISFIVLVASCWLIYGIYKWYKKRNLFNQREEYYKLLDNLDLNDTKRSAYALTLYGGLFKNDSENHKEMFDNLLSNLERYKYKKDVDKFDESTLHLLELYRKSINV